MLAFAWSIADERVDLNQQKEQLNHAYVRAVAATAGYTCYKPEVDFDSVDLGIAATGGNGTTRSPRLEMQLKATASTSPTAASIPFVLKLKNYDDLRGTNFMVPRILVVLLVPDDVTDWLMHSEKELAMRRCGYWLSLRGMPDTPNTTAVTVHVPRSQQFTVPDLAAIMARVGSGQLP
jgi:hypothetical protein